MYAWLRPTADPRRLARCQLQTRALRNLRRWQPSDASVIPPESCLQNPGNITRADASMLARIGCNAASCSTSLRLMLRPVAFRPLPARRPAHGPVGIAPPDWRDVRCRGRKQRWEDSLRDRKRQASLKKSASRVEDPDVQFVFVVRQVPYICAGTTHDASHDPDL